MSATLEQIFDYEQVEDAWIHILNGCGLTCYPEFSDVDKDATNVPYVCVSLQNVVPTGHLYPYQDEQLHDWWKANMISRIITARGINSDRHRVMTGRVRMEIQRYQSTFLASVLPYHYVRFFRETALTRGTENMLDWSEIHAEISFNVRDDAWPA